VAIAARNNRIRAVVHELVLAPGNEDRMKHVLVAPLLMLTVGASPPVARFGYIAPTAREPVWQPILDRYASEIEQGFAQTIPASVVAVTAAQTRDGSAKACRALDISGFVEPHAH
jgi:hypothetical protein